MKAKRMCLMCVLAGVAVASGYGKEPVVRQEVKAARTIRNALWLWGHQAGSYNRDGAFGLPGKSRMTPVEGACYLGVPNVMFVRFGNQPEPPFRQHALPMRRLNRIVWSIVGDASSKANDQQPDLKEVIALGGEFPNLSGALMDDFFSGDRGRYTPGQISGFRRQLHAAKRPLDLYVVLYTHDLDKPVKAHLDAVDAVTFWTWKAKDLGALESNFRRLEELAPDTRKLLGVYMWDFGGQAPMPLDAMEHQCRLGLEWLRAGRVEGLVFLTNCIMDLDLEAVEYARRLIDRVGDEPLPDRGTRADR